MDPFWTGTHSTLKHPDSTDDDENYLQQILNDLIEQEDQPAVVSQINPGGRVPEQEQVRNESGVSSGVVLNQTNGSTVQGQTSQSQSASEKKRKADKEYRERIKKRYADMELNSKNLTAENESLKTENQSLKEENANMNQTLEDQTKENERLRSDLLLLKHNDEKKNVRLQTRSKRRRIKRKNLDARIRRLRGVINEIKREQEAIKTGQKQFREKFECEQLRKETELVTKQSFNTQLRLALMFLILRARESNDVHKAAMLTQILRELQNKTISED